MTGTAIAGIYFGIVFLYFLEHLAYSIGIFRGCRPPEGGAPFDDEEAPLSTFPYCTVLVCARNEEDNIGRCVESLDKLRYPRERLQVLIVDDKSTDRTPAILAEWQRKMPNLSVMRTGEEIAHLRGKVNALTQGMDAATGEFVMITDADSHVSPNWVREYLKFYRDNTGMVASITLLEVHNFFDGLQSIDWAYLLGISMASSNINIPLSVIGNNMSVRKKAYEDVGGYRNIPFSITEDYALFNAIWHKKPWKVRYPVHVNLTVISKATPNLKAWWHQKHRWVKGGEGLKAQGYFIYLTGLLGNIALVTAPFFMSLPAALAVILFKCSADLLIILPVLARTQRTGLLKYFPIYEIYLFFFVLSMPFMIAKKNVMWKGRVYEH